MKRKKKIEAMLNEMFDGLKECEASKQGPLLETD
jgi:chaperonin cofactor prefoldin